MRGVSIIVPTLNEVNNIDSLIEEVVYVMDGMDYELVFVDDYSRDGTAEKILEWGREFPNVRLLRKPSKIRDLSKSVLYGIRMSKKDIILVMDGDLAHPPEKIPEMLDHIDDYEIVIGTRKRVENWPGNRKRLSKLGKFLIRPIARVEDPLSGFFAFKRSTLNGIRLNPLGYKILIEILVKANSKNIKEIEFTFNGRKFGSSKLNNIIMIQYLIHLIKLYFYVLFRR